LVILVALAFLPLPGGPAIAGAMLFLYFSRWWRR
jgi:RNA-directed DNA polymerase